MWYLVDKGLAKGDDLFKAKRRFGPCYPNFGLVEGVGTESQESYGFNRTHPDQPLSLPYKFLTSAEMGSDPSGQTSASIDSQYNVVPSSGFATIIIPFFSETFLEEENGHWSNVTDFRPAMYEVTSGRAEPNFWCIRLSWDGENIKQLCDPNNAGNGTAGTADGPEHKGETTGVVSAAVLTFWDDMKQAHWLDAQSRIVTLTLPLRNNHNGMRMRLSMVIQISANGGVLPSYDIDSRHDAAAVGMDVAMVLLWVTLVLVVYFLMIEAFEARTEGLGSYFTNMWNAMDWAGFLLFFLVFDSYQKLFKNLHDQSCDNGAVLCTGVGFNDGWAAMSATKTCKQLLSIASTLQMLKIIKFVNVFVPKMALATSVLSHGLADLFMFTIFFLFTIFAFGQMFFIQLGAIDPSYLGQFASFISLFRALFGDFDIQLIMDSSDSYLNGMLFVAYLFSAVFILLSIFLTILGEHQGYVREDDPSLNSWGVVGKINTYVERKRDIILGRMGAGGSKKKGSTCCLQLDSPTTEPFDTPCAVTQLASLSRDDKATADETEGDAFNGEQRQEGGHAGAFAPMWEAKTSLEKLDDKTHELSSEIEELETSGADPEKLAQLQEDLAVVKQLQTARLIQKAQELRKTSLGPDSPELEDPPRRHGIFGTMPRPVDTKALAHDVAKIRAMLSRQEAMLKRLLGEGTEGEDASGGAIATMRLQSRSRQGSGIRRAPRNGPSGNSEPRTRSAVRTDEVGAEGQRAPAIVLRRTSPDSERQHTRTLSDHSGVSGVSSGGAPAAVEHVRERRSTGSGRERRHTTTGSSPATTPGGEQTSPTTPGGERRSVAAKPATVFSTVQSSGV